MKYLFNLYNAVLVSLYLILCWQISSKTESSLLREISTLSAEILLMLLWGMAISWNKVRNGLSNFSFDVYMITYSCVIGSIIMIIFEEKNVDVLGWWPVAIIFFSIAGLTFAVFFAMTASLIGPHMRYTKLISYILILFFMVSVIFPKYFNIIVVIMMLLHIVRCVYGYMKKKEVTI